MTGPLLRRVTITRLDTGGWSLLRERDDNGERFVVDDLHDALDTTLAAYRPDGTPRWDGAEALPIPPEPPPTEPCICGMCPRSTAVRSTEKDT